MDITTNDDWVATDDDNVFYATTSDPRVLAVIERDTEASVADTFDGDGINPIIYVDHSRGRLSFSHEAGFDGGEADLMQRAYDEWGWGTPTARRWLWIFHGIAAENAWGGYDRSGNWIVATSRAYAENVGNEPAATFEDARKDCESMAKEVGEALDGNVFGIGYATLEGRVLDEGEIDLDEWTIDIECWGFVGEQYAKSEAATFEHGGPDLPELINDDVFREHTDYLAEQDIRDAELADRG